MKQILVRYINIILGAIVAAFALEEFLVPANILDGGIVGTSIIISSITPISLSILTVCLNLPFEDHCGNGCILSLFRNF